ncbi:hypothetical protein [[Kitasatospora] papulosa]|uniref:Uncharacterized protein n=1 Tax=[Kitasatospora] papulosa TaxID=1464011 RepID=A0ABZ1K3J7_9ACTN
MAFGAGVRETVGVGFGVGVGVGTGSETVIRTTALSSAVPSLFAFRATWYVNSSSPAYPSAGV